MDDILGTDLVTLREFYDWWLMLCGPASQMMGRPLYPPWEELPPYWQEVFTRAVTKLNERHKYRQEVLVNQLLAMAAGQELVALG